MKEYIIDNFGIWEKGKHINNPLDGLGFFNSYAGIEDVRRLILRTREYNDIAIDLTFKTFEKLLEDSPNTFKKCLARVHNLLMRTECMYNRLSENAKRNGIELTDGKYYITDQESMLDEDLPIVTGINKLLVEIKEYLSSEPDEILKCKGVKEVKKTEDYPSLPKKRYGKDEEEFVLANYKVLTVAEIASCLDRSYQSVQSYIKRLVKNGRL